MLKTVKLYAERIRSGGFQGLATPALHQESELLLREPKMAGGGLIINCVSLRLSNVCTEMQDKKFKLKRSLPVKLTKKFVSLDLFSQLPGNES